MADRRAPRERGQATTETIMLTWLLLIFFAASYQVFLVNESVYRSMAAVHEKMFELAFPANCYSDSSSKCRYNSDKTANVTWREKDFPEIKIRTVNIFTRWGMPGGLVVKSNARPASADKGCPVPCKHTKMAVGAYWPIWDCSYAFWATCLK